VKKMSSDNFSSLDFSRNKPKDDVITAYTSIAYSDSEVLKAFTKNL